MQLVDNNYLRSSGNGPTWTVEIDPPRRSVKSYYEETLIAAEMLWERKQGKLQLCYSGGLDSEYVLSILLKFGMTVEVVIMRTQYNYHETQYAFKFCEAKNITPTVIDLDYDKFVESGQLLEIAESIKCAAFQIPCNMWLASQLDGTVITGNDPPHLKLNPKDNLWYLDEEEIIHSQLAYWNQHGLDGTPFLLSYTPEQMLAFLVDPAIEKLANHGFPGRLGTNSTKVEVFNRGTGFNLEQRIKQTGYEHVETSPIFQHPDIQTVVSRKDRWLGTSDHQYHKVIKTLSAGLTSSATASIM
jgi:hypothetical protein